MLSSHHFKVIMRGVREVLTQNRRQTMLRSSRSISTTSRLLANYYDVLGITASATQGDIKAAYYKLSMLYHPDKNKDNESAVTQFRAITEAYEVLGNFRLRRLYDKGIIHTAGTQYSHMRPRYPDDEVAPEPEDDAQTKFYKAHMKKSQVPNATGRTPIYDFDEWSRAHYGATFARRKAGREKHERNQKKRQSDALMFEKEVLLYGLTFLITCFVIVFIHEHDLDTVHERKVVKTSQETSDGNSSKETNMSAVLQPVKN